MTQMQQGTPAQRTKKIKPSVFGGAYEDLTPAELRSAVTGYELRHQIEAFVAGITEKSIKVVYDGTGAHTAESRMVLPTLPQTFLFKPGDVRILIGYAAHEICHHLETDFDYVYAEDPEKPTAREVQRFQWFNAIEDYRIEKLAKVRYPGFAGYIGHLREFTTRRYIERVTSGHYPQAYRENPYVIGAVALTWVGGQLNAYPTTAHEEALLCLEPQLQTYIRSLGPRMATVITQDDAFKLACEIMDELEAASEAAEDKTAEDGADDQSSQQNAPRSAGQDKADGQEDSAGEKSDQTSQGPADDHSDEPDQSGPSDEEERDNQDTPSDQAGSEKTSHGDSEPDDGSEAEQVADDENNQGDHEAGEANGDEAESDPNDAASANEGSPDCGDREEADADQSSDQGENSGDDANLNEPGDREQGGESAAGDDAAHTDADEQNDGGCEQSSQQGSASSGNEGSGSSSPGQESTDNSDPDRAEDDDAGPDDNPSSDARPDNAAPQAPRTSAADRQATAEKADLNIDELIEALSQCVTDADKITPETNDPISDASDADMKGALSPNERAAVTAKGAAGVADDMLRRTFIGKCQKDYAEVRRNLGSAAARTSGVVRRLLLARNRTSRRSNLEEGRLDLNRLVPIVNAANDVYYSVKQQRDVNTAVSIMLDNSGSMSGYPLKVCQQAAVTLDQAIAGTGTDLEITGFTTTFPGYRPQIYFYRRFGQKGQQASASLGRMTDVRLGGTPCSVQMLDCMRRLKQHKADRKIMIIVTDGAVDDPERTAAVHDLIVASGVQVLGVGLACDNIADWCDNCCVIQDMDDFPAALATLIQNSMTTSKKRTA